MFVNHPDLLVFMVKVNIHIFKETTSYLRVTFYMMYEQLSNNFHFLNFDKYHKICLTVKLVSLEILNKTV